MNEESINEAERVAAERKYNNSPLFYLRNKKYIEGKVGRIECLILENGNAVIITNSRDYLIYNNEDSMIKSASNFKINKIYHEFGLIEKIERNTVLYF